MKTLRFLTLFALLGFTSFAQVNWNFDKSHSNVMFNVTHMVISEVTGFFKGYDGKVSSKADNDFTDAKIDFTIDAKSIFTDNDKRDDHLRSDDFFNTEKFPTITFKSKSMKKGTGNSYKLTGDLTIRDITKTVTLDVTFNGNIKDGWGNERASFKIKGSVNRFDYNLKWNSLLEAGGAVVGKDVEIVANVQLIKDKKS
ncbi:MAG: YceI family protein [Ignavibacteriaceae bacterium]|nr:YceI family protein [Ignavibacteriaceae bacterium]